jgi:imidazole glycerol-phosphate synthase subunit HisF
VLKRRIIPVQLLRNGRLVKTVGFEGGRDVGDPISSSKVYSDQDADELLFLNIDRASRTIESLLPLIERVSEVCFMPLTMGGGIRCKADAAKLIRAGADKIAINSAAYSNYCLIESIAGEFGAQAVVAGVDVLRDEAGHPMLFSDCGRRRETMSLETHVEALVHSGAGELLINSIDRDGRMDGYDIPLLKGVVDAISVPVIGCGGAGHFEHLKEAFLQADVSALACGSLFNFGDNNPIRAKAFLSNYGLPFKVI